jgi:hypothetical protein
MRRSIVGWDQAAGRLPTRWSQDNEIDRRNRRESLDSQKRTGQSIAHLRGSVFCEKPPLQLRFQVQRLRTRHRAADCEIGRRADRGGKTQRLRLHCLIAGKDLVSFLVRDRTGNDDVVSLAPICRGRHAMLGSELDRVENPHNLIEVAARRHGVSQSELDAFIWSDDENGAHWGVLRRRAAIGSIAGVSLKHVIKLGDLQLWIADQRIGHRMPTLVLAKSNSTAVQYCFSHPGMNSWFFGHD